MSKYILGSNKLERSQDFWSSARTRQLVYTMSPHHLHIYPPSSLSASIPHFRLAQPVLKMHLSTSISGLVLSSALVSANDYAASCGQFTLNPNQYTMEAVCGDGKGGYRTSRENLALCIGNANGVLVAQNEYVHFLFPFSIPPNFPNPTAMTQIRILRT